MADGKVIIQIDGDTKDFEKSLSGLGGIAQKALGAVTTAVAGIGTAFAVAGAKSLGIASNLQEVQNVVDVTFGEGAKQIEAFANTAGEAFGLSELQAKKYSSTLGAMLKSSGLAEEATLEMSQTMTGLVGDFASFYNLDHETAFQKIQSATAGEVEPLMLAA